MLGFAAGFYASLRIGNLAGGFTSPIGALMTTMGCIAQGLGWEGLEPPFGIPLPHIPASNNFSQGGGGANCTNPTPLPNFE